ncbi:MAG: O-antigen ligase family protein, partial [Desulfosalsimonadaceae bacterium]
SFSPGLPGLSALILILYLILRSLFSAIPAPAYYLAAVFSPVFVFAAMHSVFSVKKFLLFINILVTLSVGYAFLQYASGMQRPYSFFGNPIFLSEFLLINFSLVIISTFYFRKNTFYFTLNTLGILVVMALSSSRGPLISVSIQFILLSLILVHNRYISLKKLLLYSFSVLFSAVIISGLFFSVSRDTAFPERFSPKTLLDSPAFNNRILMGKTAYALGLESPVFGSGPGSYKYYHPFYQSFLLKKDAAHEFVNTSYTHNDYMQYFSEFGITGLLLFLVFLFACAARFDASYPYLEKKHLLISSALACSLFSVIIESFFNFPLPPGRRRRPRAIRTR